MHGDGDGWTTCDLGHRHWGRFGAAGLLLRASARPEAETVAQLRSDRSHHGGTWGLPGGARDSHETAWQAAVREAGEEVGLAGAELRPEAILVDDHGGWSYRTLIASPADPLTPRPRPSVNNAESDAVEWVAPDDLDARPLHPGFARTWPRLRGLGAAPVLLLDAANVVGSRPDGWWRDRAGANRRLCDRLAAFSASGPGLPDRILAELQHRTPAEAVAWFPRLVMVTEGAARGVQSTAAVEVVAADGSGDDTLVAQAERWSRPNDPQPRRPVILVSADRGLAARVRHLGVDVLGPRAVLDLLEP